jgi:hypothetical protein
MEVRAGMRVWIPCEVKPGVFSNERVVSVQRSHGVWTGFVPESVLRERIDRGQTAVQALIYEVREGIVEAFLPGDSVTPGTFVGPVEWVTPIGAVAA